MIEQTGVELYQHINYTGYKITLHEGTYHKKDIINLGIKTNDISSIKINGKYRVTFYDEDKLSGKAYTTIDHITNFVTIGWNDKLSSIKISLILNEKNNGVHFYQHINYNGYTVTLDEGTYYKNDIVISGIKNNDISSIKIVGNYKVTLFDNDNLDGNSYTTTNNINNFVSIGWNDILSSIKIENISIENNLYDSIRDSIVTLTVFSNNSIYANIGTGFFIKGFGSDNDLYIATVAHLVMLENRDNLVNTIYASISNFNNEEIHKIVECSIIGIAGQADIAILKTVESIPNQNFLSWNTSKIKNNGDICYVLGDPLGKDEISISSGLIRDNKFFFHDISTYYNTVESICISAPIYKGNSGSPILNKYGDIIGIISYGISNTESFSWGCSESIMQPIFKHIIDNNSNFVGGTLNAILYNVDAIYFHNSNKTKSLDGYYVYSTSNNELNINDLITHISNELVGVYYNQTTIKNIYLNPKQSLLFTIINSSNETINKTLYINEIPINDDVPLSGGNNSNIIKIGPIKKLANNRIKSSNNMVNKPRGNLIPSIRGRQLYYK